MIKIRTSGFENEDGDVVGSCDKRGGDYKLVQGMNLGNTYPTTLIRIRASGGYT